MATSVIMPKQGQSVESCIITKWFKQKGDEVKEGDLLFAYETDKASFEATAEVGGYLLELRYNEGDEVPVLSEVAVIGMIGEEPNQSLNKAEKKESIEKPLLLQQNSEILKNDVYTEKKDSLHYDTVKSISPLARKIAIEQGIDISTISGSGPKGRIIKQDILIQVQSGIKTLKKEEKTSIQGSDYKDIKLSNVRKIIGKAMLESLRNAAQLTHHMSADVRRLLEFRNKIKASKNQLNITLNDLVCFCVIKALKSMPEVNSHFVGDSIRTFNKVHLGLAVDTPRGLMVPVLKNAEDLSLIDLSHQLKILADQCRSGSINPDLLSSSAASFTISNLGAYGVEMFTPVINLPQVAILGVCTIINRPADLGNGIFGFVPYIGLSLTYDHRALDGGPATLFLKEIKKEIENFESII
jgi:pyruvate dehydrogenase E2 component (dihydrolipoamide acetyltransferase)